MNALRVTCKNNLLPGLFKSLCPPPIPPSPEHWEGEPGEPPLIAPRVKPMKQFFRHAIVKYK